MAKCVFEHSSIEDLEWKCFDLPVIIHSITSYVYNPLTDCLTLDTKVDSLLHGGKAIHGASAPS